MAPKTFGPDCENLYKRQVAAEIDPFPFIPAALLNSSDIVNYANATGMLHPFDERKLKPASYVAAIKGLCIFWDENNDQKIIDLQEPTQQFTLAANSIAFVQVEPCFHLPNYIALRFNLKITHVHRGILLGTGPLIDPGYQGKLLIPLHNLTTNTYTFSAGDELIWIEFTKTSPHKEWDPGWHNRAEEEKAKMEWGDDQPWRYYKEKPIVKFNPEKYLSAPQFLAKASPHKPIKSSIPDVIRQSALDAQKARQRADMAKKQVEKVKNYIGIGALAGVIAIGLPIFSLIQDAVGVDNSQNQLAKDFVATTKEQIKLVQQELAQIHEQDSKELRDTNRHLEETIKVLQHKIDEFEARLPKAEAQSIKSK